MPIRFDDRVAIVTGAGTGLGRAHAMGLAERGAKVLANDLGGALDGSGGSATAAESVVAEIENAGGTAISSDADVTDPDAVEAMVADVVQRFGRVDILVNNAGILRDKSFAKMELDDFRAVLEVHVMGSVHCTKAVWPIMREQHYGRVVMTTSSSGIYGNFGQANYGTAKAGLVGLMNVLHQEGERYDIRVNTLSPTAATRMTQALMPDEMLDVLKPEAITPGLLYLVSEDAPSRTILCAGAGCFARAYIHETEGVYLEPEARTPEDVAAAFEQISDESGQRALESAFEQTEKYAARAAAAQGIVMPPREKRG